MEDNLSTLISKWRIREDFAGGKSHCGSSQDSYEDYYGMIPPWVIVRLLPDIVIGRLLASDFKLTYNNGSGNSSYEPLTDRSQVKSTSDILHEVGHALWYHSIPREEDHKWRATATSFVIDENGHKIDRIEVPDELVPTFHKQYASLVGAYSGQFLTEGSTNPRERDLEEQFACNFDRFCRGEPLEVMPCSEADDQDILSFYHHHRVADGPSIGLWKIMRNRFYGPDNGIKRVSLTDREDTQPLTTEILLRQNAVRLEEFDGLRIMPITQEMEQYMYSNGLM